MPGNDLRNRLIKLESELKEAQRLVVVQKEEIASKERIISLKDEELKAVKREKSSIEQENKVLKRQIASLTSEKQQLLERIKKLEGIRIKPTPTQLMNSFKVAMDKLQQTLQPRPGDRFGYTVSHFDVDMKAAITIDQEDETLKFVLPEPGEDINPELLSSVRFTLSSVPKVEPSDKDLIEVPMLLGLDLSKAEELLQSKGLAAGQIDQKVSSYPEGTVIAQKPDPGDLVPPEGAIDLVVALSPTVKVPALLGMNLDEAKTVLENSGLKLGKVEEREDGAPKGTVVAQHPKAEELAERGLKVDLVITKSPSFEKALKAILSHPDVKKMGISPSSLKHRLKNAEVDTVEELEKLYSLTDRELKARLKLRTFKAASIFKGILKQVLYL